MTREQKQALALMVVGQVADMFEDIESPFGRHHLPDGLSIEEAQAQVALWLDKLPTGNAWDRRLPDPMDVREARQS